MLTWGRQLLTVPNAITIVRLPLLAWFVWEAAHGNFSFAFWLFIFIWLLDWVDGSLARLLGQATRVGYYLDKVVDRIVMVIGVVVLIRYGILPPIALLLFTRDIGYVPAVYPVRSVQKNWAGAGVLGKIVTALQGAGFLWLYFDWPYEIFIVGLTAVLGALVAVRHLRQLIVVTLLLFLPSVVNAQVMFSEMMWDGVEYIELHSDEGVSLEGWNITRQKTDGEEKEVVAFDKDDRIAAGQYYLIEKNEEATSVAADKIVGSLVLVNTGEIVRLYSGGNVVDSVGDGGAWPAGKNTDTGVAMEKVGGDWITASGSLGGRNGSPGAAPVAGEENGVDESAESENIQKSYSRALVISELLPNPVGNDAVGEFIELYNPSGDVQDVSGWELDDGEGGSKPYVLPDGTTVSGRSYMVFSREKTGIALNNTGDSVRLLDPSGTVRVEVSYESPVAEGQSYSRSGNGDYSWTTTVTSGSANVITQPVVTPKPTTTSKKSVKASATPAASSVAGTVAGVTSGDIWDVVIVRALPNPEGADAEGEFVELQNNEEVDVSLAGWQLDDEEGGSAPYDFPIGTTIAAGQSAVFSREETGIALNNGGDVVRLIGLAGEVIDSLEYGKVAEGEIVEAFVAGSFDELTDEVVFGNTTDESSEDAKSVSEENIAQDSDDQVVLGLNTVTAGVRDDSDSRAEEGAGDGMKNLAVTGVLIVGAAGAALFAYGSPKEVLERVKRLVLRSEA